MADLGPDLDMACSKRWKVDAKNCCFKEGNQGAVTWMKEDKPDLTEDFHRHSSGHMQDLNSLSSLICKEIMH